MTDFSDLMEHVKKLLPTVALRIATATTLGAAISIAALPGYLKEVWPDMHIPEVLLFQAALISTTLLIGSFIMILLLLRHIQSLNDKADLEKKLALINKYLELSRISWAMVESEVNKTEAFNIGLEKALKYHQHP